MHAHYRSRRVVEPLLPLIFDFPSQEIVTYGNREAKPQGTRIPWECIAMRHFSKLSGHLLGSTAGCWDWDVPKIIKMHIFGRFCSLQKCIKWKCLLEFYFFWVYLFSLIVVPPRWRGRGQLHNGLWALFQWGKHRHTQSIFAMHINGASARTMRSVSHAWFLYPELSHCCRSRFFSVCFCFFFCFLERSMFSKCIHNSMNAFLQSIVPVSSFSSVPAHLQKPSHTWKSPHVPAGFAGWRSTPRPNRCRTIPPSQGQRCIRFDPHSQTHFTCNYFPPGHKSPIACFSEKN